MGPNRVYVCLIEEFVASIVQEMTAIYKGEYIPSNPFLIRGAFILLFEILSQIFSNKRNPENLDLVEHIKEYCRGPLRLDLPLEL